MAMEGNYSDGGSIDGEVDLYPNRQTANSAPHRDNHHHLNNNVDAANHSGRRYKNQENGDVIDSHKGMKGDPREVNQNLSSGERSYGRRHSRVQEPAYYSDEDLTEGELEEGMNERRTDKRRQPLRNNSGGDGHRQASRESGHGPNVIVTQANVHLSQEEMDDLDRMEEKPSRQRHPSGGDRHNESSHIRRNDRKYQSHNNLSRPMTNEDKEMEKVSRNASQYYTPRPRRKQRHAGKYDSRQSSEDELRDLANHIDPRVTHPMSRAGSMADVGKGGDFTMPKSKMGSFQDFKPIKHSQSSPRVSADKGRG